MKKHAYLPYVLLLLFSSCISISSHKTARTRGKGKAQVGISAESGKVGSTIYEYYMPNQFAVLNAFGEFGLSKRFDVNFGINSSSLFIVGGKFQYLGSPKSIFASAIGIDAGGSPLLGASVFGGIGGRVMSYHSIHIADVLSFSFNPQLALSRVNNIFEGGYPKNDWISGYCANVQIGKRYKVSLEYTQLARNSWVNETSPWMAGIGFIFPIDDVEIKLPKFSDLRDYLKGIRSNKEEEQ